MARRASRRPPRSRLLLRWLAIGAVCLIAFLYYRPLRTYLETRHELSVRTAEVQVLRARRNALEKRFEISTSDAALAREARRLAYVRPGERLFIVKGIGAWRKRLRASVARHGG